MNTKPEVSRPVFTNYSNDPERFRFDISEIGFSNGVQATCDPSQQGEMWILNTWRLWNQSSRLLCEYQMQGIVNIWRLWNHSSRILYSVFNPSDPERFRLKLIDFFAINPSVPEGFRLRLPGKYKSKRETENKSASENPRKAVWQQPNASIRTLLWVL